MQGFAAARTVKGSPVAVAPLDAEALGLYVHVPFCARKCPYCDFVSGPVEALQRSAYLKALEGEIRNCRWVGNRARSVFFGGGTPSELGLQELSVLVSALRDSFRIEADAEWTIECNPGTLPDAGLLRLRELGFNRVSLGVQSVNDRHLKTLGRVHSAAQSKDSFRRLRAAGFDNLNLDLMFAIPGQTLEEWIADLEWAIQAGPEHLSLYNLTVEPDTEFGRLKRRGELAETDEETAAVMFETAVDLTADAGFEQYEISNYAVPGRRSRHNLIYWRRREYLGFGVGAASFMGGVRWANTSRLGEYASSALQGRPVRAFRETLSPLQAMGEHVMLGLRTSEGIVLRELRQRYGRELPEAWIRRFEELSKRGCLSWTGQGYRPTRRGRMVADEMAAMFL